MAHEPAEERPRQGRAQGAEVGPDRRDGVRGTIELFFRTLKEQLLSTRRFKNAEEVRLAVVEWVRVYDEEWLIERHGDRAPAAKRRELVALNVRA